MRLKRWVLIFLSVSIFQIILQDISLLAQEDKDAQDIKIVVEGFLKGFVLRDLDYTVRQISVNYNDQVMDYDKFRELEQNVMNDLKKNYVDYSITVQKYNNLNIQGDRANVEVEFSWRGFNLDILKWKGGKQKRLVSFAKENGSWRITQWKLLERSDLEF